MISEVIQLACVERILFQKNDSKLGIMNGEFGRVIKINGETIAVKLDDQREITFDVNRYREFNYGYATTIHKAHFIIKHQYSLGLR